MKRSKMINLILQEFPEWNDQIKLDEYDIHGILSIIEKAGMLPPKIITLDLGDCHRFECKWENEE